jgi:carboxymethylenebutenolidase
MYLARPPCGAGPGVLVLHSWWGLNEFFRSFCDRLADEGFTALAPDLYGGKTATTIPEARLLRARVTATRKEPAYKYLMRMFGLLSSHVASESASIGLIGFSMGGHWAYWLAQRPELPIAATVTFYAARDGRYSKSSSTFLAHFAETDTWVSLDGVKKLKRSLTVAGKHAMFNTYPGTGHWFFEEDRTDCFHPEAAALAWERTLAFLKERLVLISAPQP